MTPMMEQWSGLKAQAGNAFLFFRLGDFFELFGDDAIRAAPIMGVTLTSRNSKAQGSDAPALCGVPVGNFEAYLHKLLDRGHCIALADQVEEAAPGKKLVRREIVQHFTPGMRLLEANERPHYTGVFCGNEKNWVLAAADVSTGHLVLESGTGWESLQDILDRLPVEDLRTPYGEKCPVTCLYHQPCNLLSEEEAKTRVMNALGLVDTLDAPCETSREWAALGSLLRILEEAHPRQRLFYTHPLRIPNGVQMSAATRRHLNLFEPAENSLFQFLDETKTAIGRRILKLYLSQPTQDLEEIRSRQEHLEFWKKNSWARQQLKQELAGMHDIQRLLRLKKHPQRLFQLSASLLRAEKIADLLSDDQKMFRSYKEKLSEFFEMTKNLEERLQWSDLADRGWIKPGVNEEIDSLRHLQQNAEKLLMDAENSLREELKVNSLKIRFHQVFGYVAEVTRQHQEKIPSRARQIQSLANSIRFKTSELEDLETKLLSLESRLIQAEAAEVEKLYAEIERQSQNLMEFSELLGQIDVTQSLAEVSVRESWTRPLLSSSESCQLKLVNATHPLSRESFVPLSFELSQAGTQLILLTGPNMAGKSTVLRVAAIASLLHQIGSDVPAEEAELSIFDRIMCRMGAMDDLTQGKSTFFVEMKEVASMLYGAGSKSLLLFDEIGRGTSTYDGMSLAWAITEAVHELRTLSIIATHYLELADLESRCSRLKNYHLGVRELDGQLLFTRRLERGPANQSYGIQVARLAALPTEILERAEQKLKEFEKTPQDQKRRRTPLFEWAERHV